MWKCKCGVENGDNTNFCSGCGEKKTSTVNSSDSGYYTQQTSLPAQSDSRKSFSYSFHSCAASALDYFSGIEFVASIVLAVIILIIFSIKVDGWEKLMFSGAGFFTGLLWCGGIVFFGYVAKILLQGLAVIVEANYRSMEK